MDEDRRKQMLDEKKRTLAALRLEKQRREETRNTVDPRSTVDPRITVVADGAQRQNGRLFAEVYTIDILGTISASSSARNMEELLRPLGIPTQTMPTSSLPLQRNGSSNLLQSNGSLNNFAVSDGSVSFRFVSSSCLI